MFLFHSANVMKAQTSENGVPEAGLRLDSKQETERLYILGRILHDMQNASIFDADPISPLTQFKPSHRIPPNMNSAHFSMTMTTTTSGTHREAYVLGMK
ncbi:MAG TPA: hypothetical protein PKI33_10050 [Anaerolineales bacterium]|nr:hypothetical protein [Anaerolineales bacterium]